MQTTLHITRMWHIAWLAWLDDYTNVAHSMEEAWGFEKHRAFMSPQPTTWVHLKWALQEEANGASEANSTIVRAFKKLTI